MSYKIWKPFPHPGCWKRWPEMNRRRCDLISKDVRSTIDTEEKEELEYLQREAQAMLDKWFPRPPVIDLDALEERLKSGQES